jgi:hypothetical protein
MGSLKFPTPLDGKTTFGNRSAEIRPFLQGGICTKCCILGWAEIENWTYDSNIVMLHVITFGGEN